MFVTQRLERSDGECCPDEIMSTIGGKMCSGRENRGAKNGKDCVGFPWGRRFCPCRTVRQVVVEVVYPTGR